MDTTPQCVTEGVLASCTDTSRLADLSVTWAFGAAHSVLEFAFATAVLLLVGVGVLVGIRLSNGGA